MLTKNIDRMKTEIARHIAADAVVGGSYWNETDNAVGGTGCFIGCLTHSSNAASLEGKYGLPLMLTRILEGIFERLPTDEQPVFFREIGDAIGCDGRDLTLVQWAFLEDVLRHLPVQKPEITAVIDPVIEGMQKLASGDVWDREAAYAADAADAAYTSETQRQRAAILRLIGNAPVMETGQ